MEIDVPFPFVWGEGKTQSPNISEFIKLPPATAAKLLDYDDDKVEIQAGFISNTWFLHVGGTTPYYNMRVELVPVQYVDKPEYWEIQVIGTLQEVGLPSTKPYHVSILLGPFIGKQGVQVVGATKHAKLQVPPT